MFPYRVEFDAPGYLLLLLALPLVWYVGRRGLTALGPWRGHFAFVLRVAVAAAVVLALAEAHVVRISDRLAVIYLLDQSLSVSAEQSRAAIEFINRSRSAPRDRRQGDVAGVIVFGREPLVELPPWEHDVPLLRVESRVDGQYTDLASALRLARACFPADCAKRLVILSDGNENLESALAEARSLVDAEIGIDVVPLQRAKSGDVAVEKVVLPAEARRGSPFDVRVVLDNSYPATSSGGAERSARGRLRIVRTAGGREEPVAEQAVEVRPGKQVFSFREELEVPNFYTYEAQFVPESADDDLLPQNNRATAFTQVHGQGRVLLIEDFAQPGEFAYLVERLRAAKLEVDVRPSNQAFANLAELQSFDTVILANLPRTSGEDAADLTVISDEQIDMLVRNTQQMGGGLVMLGGPNSFGAGGWANTGLERAMPVDFQIKNAKVIPSGALMLVIDRSGSMIGEKLEMSKTAAVAALKMLGPRDYIGVVAFDAQAYWVVPIQRVGSGNAAAQRIMQIGSEGGTNMMPGMVAGYRALAGVDTSIKHMIVLTDGQTEGSGHEQLSARMRNTGITTTCVAVGKDAAGSLMSAIARTGGGKFYRVDQPTLIPRIFMKEARRVARPLVYESEQAFQPTLNFPHEMLGGIQAPLPPITGYVMTTVKENPLVEISLSSPQPGASRNVLLASWNYGLGRTVALTTDVGQRWAQSWTSWESYDKLLTQIVRWSMRPSSGDDRITLAAEVHDGKLRVVVTALDQQAEFLNFLTMRGTVIDSSMRPIDLPLRQAAPGRYLGECPLENPGSYFVTIVPGRGLAPLRTGVDVAYSAEFRDLESNDALLSRLAEQSPRRGPPGRVIPLAPASSNEAAVFRHDLPRAVTRQPCWHWMVFGAACLFFCDVFNRRVVVSWAALAPLASRLGGLLRRRNDSEPASTVMDRLRQRKAEVGQQLDERRIQARFESSAPAVGAAIAEPAASLPPATSPESAPSLSPDEIEDSYTSRLLKAKREVWKKP